MPDEKLREILKDLEKVLMNTYKADGCFTSAITEIYINQVILAIKKLWWEEREVEMKLSEQQVLELRCKLERFITQREGMIAENKFREHRNEAMAYGDSAFDKLGAEIQELEDHICWLGEK